MELERPLSTRLLSGPRGAFSKEDMEVGCHWVKQICGLAVGITCGIVPVTGVAGFISFASAALFGTWFMYAKVMRVDLDFEAQLELWKEGSLSATATFILVWTGIVARTVQYSYASSCLINYEAKDRDTRRGHESLPIFSTAH